MNPFAAPYVDLQRLRTEHPERHRKAIAEITDLIHMFVDSGLPPILLFGTSPDDGHAVVVVGHDIVVDRKFDTAEVAEVYGGVLRNSCFVGSFFVLDDARGPYVPFRVYRKNSDDCPSLEQCDYVGVAVHGNLPSLRRTARDASGLFLSLLTGLCR
jgi:hypothetical protein